ncbi:MAG: flagellar hook-basal body complex protein [Phycisphaerales bacterium]|jgi:flagellar hook protein FlgE|nr:flagellar hook-basal body complex protein [Phycisphaerales bacterium]
MASTVAMFNALSGLNANARFLDVTGNNIANVNTTAFKHSRVHFQTMISQTRSMGGPPDENTGGTNPTQIGLGVRLANVQRDFNGGTISGTGVPGDMAIDGNGFFITRRDTETYYTRAGSFRRDENGDLVTLDGDRVQGFGVDSSYNVAEGSLVDLNIPLGSLTIAEQTTLVRMAGNLDADGTVGGSGSITRLLGREDAGLGLIAGATMTPSNPMNVLEGTSLLTEIEDPAQPGSGVPLFVAGQSIELAGVEKGGRVIDTATLAISAGTTVADLLAFLNNVLGLDPTTSNPDGSTPGATLDPTTGEITVTGHAGVSNDIEIESSDLRLLNEDGVFTRVPLTSARDADATGEGVRTSFLVWDSLGGAVEVEVSFALESRGNDGTTWRYFIESPDDSDDSPLAATGTIRFDPFGRLVDTNPIPVSIDIAGSGAATPLMFELDLYGNGDGLTALADEGSEVAATYRDGAPIGTLVDWGVDANGLIIGAFTNGLTRPLGQVAVATFTNDDGLIEVGSSAFQVGPNSGNPVVTAPQRLGAGQIIDRSLELSNVDLGEEFINMILASTGYSANSRVIQTTNDLYSQLLLIGR